jgi:hypothetical protein
MAHVKDRARETIRTGARVALGLLCVAPPLMCVIAYGKFRTRRHERKLRKSKERHDRRWQLSQPPPFSGVEGSFLAESCAFDGSERYECHDQHQSIFFKLPPEIRSQIYECVFSGTKFHIRLKLGDSNGRGGRLFAIPCFKLDGGSHEQPHSCGHMLFDDLSATRRDTEISTRRESRSEPLAFMKTCRLG